MKINALRLAALAATALASLVPLSTGAQSASPKVEYIDIRWDNTDRMCVVYPDGRVDFVGKALEAATKRPDEANKRAYYMTLELNKLTAEGYEFVAMISDEILMKRVVR